MTNTTRTFRVRFTDAFGDYQEKISTNKKEINYIAKHFLGCVDEKLNNKWTFLGHYTYDDDKFFKVVYGPEPRNLDDAVVWRTAEQTPNFYTDNNGVVRLGKEF